MFCFWICESAKKLLIFVVFSIPQGIQVVAKVKKDISREIL